MNVLTLHFNGFVISIIMEKQPSASVKPVTHIGLSFSFLLLIVFFWSVERPFFNTLSCTFINGIFFIKLL